MLSVKEERTNNEGWKAGFVVQKNRLKVIASLVHNSATLQRYSNRVFTSVSTTIKFRLLLIDVTRAYFRAQKHL